MDKSNILTLLKTTYSKDAIGQQVPAITRREVFCSIKSVSASEFYEAGRAGLNAELRADMFFYDYEGEDEAEFEGRKYGIYRTYRPDMDTIELYLERKVGI